MPIQLPPGFEIDEPVSSGSGLPAGFEIDTPEPAVEEPSPYNQAIPEEPEPEGKPDYNLARGMGERGSTLLGNLVGFAGNAGEMLEEGVASLGGFAAMPGEPLSEERPGYKYLSGDEYKAFKEAQGSTQLADEYKEDLTGADLGYEQHQGWEEGKAKLFDEEASFLDRASGIGDVVSWGFETGAVSLPDMVGAVLAPPAYLASRSNEIAEERATADGRDPKDLTEKDLAAGAVTATIVTILERFGAQKLLSFAKEGQGGIVKGMLQGGAYEGLTETQQELVEYLGAQAGTEQGVTFMEGLERSLQGLVGGGSFGAPAGGVSGLVGNFRTDPVVESTADRDAVAAAVGNIGSPDAQSAEEMAAQVVEQATPGDIAPILEDTGAPAEPEIERPVEPVVAPAPEVVADENVVPEAAETVQRQIEMMDDPAINRDAVYLPPGSPEPVTDPDLHQVVELGDGGTAIVPNTEKGRRDAQLLNLSTQMDEATKQEAIATITGLGGEGKPVGATEAVIARDADGVEIQSGMLDPAGDVLAAAEQVAEQRGGTTEITSPEAIEAERMAQTDLEAGLEAEPVTDLEAGLDETLGFVEDAARPPLTPAVAETMGAVDFALKEFADERATLGPGRKPTGNDQQRQSADTAWVALVDKLPTLQAEGYDINPLKKLLRKAAGNRAPTIATASARSGSPISGRIKAGPAGTKRAPAGGWGKVISDFYVGINQELNRMASEGPSEIPQQVTPKAETAKKVSKARTPAPMGKEALGITEAPAVTKAKAVSKKRSAPKQAAEPVLEDQVAPSPEVILEGEQEGVVVADDGIDIDQQLNTPEEEAAILAERANKEAAPVVDEAKLQAKMAEIRTQLASEGEALAASIKATNEQAAASKPVVQTRAEKAKAISKERSGKKITLGPRVPTGTEVEQAAHEAATSPKNDLEKPTEAQIEADNYKKGHISYDGVQISIENAAGTKRRPEWPALKHHYGDIKLTEGADGEAVDVFINKDNESTDTPVFIINQTNEDGTFDEHKIMLGFDTVAEARKGYLDNYTKGWTAPSVVPKLTMDQLKDWLKNGDHKKPYNQRLLSLRSQDSKLPDGQTTDSVTRWLDNAEVISARDDVAVELDETSPEGESAAGLVDIMIAGLDSRDPLVPLLEEIQTKDVDNVQVVYKSDAWMTDNIGPNSNGGFEQMLDGGRNIYLNKNMKGDAAAVKVLAHELVHAVTAAGMTTDNKLAQKMEGFRKRAIANFESLGDEDYLSEYGLTNVDEFVAEAMTNPNFQRALASIKMDGGKTSLWTKIIEAIGDFLGIPVDGHTMLSEVVSLVPDLMMTAEEVKQTVQEAVEDSQLNVISQTIDSLDAAETDFAEWMLADQSDRDNVAEVASQSNSTIAKAVGNLIGAASNKIEEATKIPLSERKRDAAKILLGFTTQDQIVRRFKEAFQTDQGNSMTDYDQISRKKTSIARAWQKKAEANNQKWKALENSNPAAAQKLSTLMHDSTLANVHVDKAFFNKANKHVWNNKSTKKQHERMKAEFNALPREARALYRTIRDSYTQQRNDMRDAAFQHLARSYGAEKALSPEEFQKLMDVKTVGDLDAVDLTPLGDMADPLVDSLKTIVGATRMQGPYFPLRRFGNYVVEGKRKTLQPYGSREAARQAAIDYKAADPTNKAKTTQIDGVWHVEKSEHEISMFENVKEAKAEEARMREAGLKGTQGNAEVTTTLKKKWEAPAGTGAQKLLGRTKEKFSDNKAVQSALDTAFIEMMVDSSMRKSELARKNVKGASTDMRRAYAERAFAGSWAIADLNTALDHNNVMTAMGNQAIIGPDAIQKGEAFEELKVRDERGLADRKTSIIDAAASKFGFIWYLFSPSYAVVNATQVPLVALPYLQGKYGATKATAALFNSYKGVTTLGGQEFARIKGGFTGAPENLLDQVTDYLKVVDPDAAMAIDELTNLGIVDATFMQELYEASRGVQKGSAGMVVEKTLDVARAAPQIVEILNRVVVARAAFNLAKDTGANQEKATQAASEAVLQTQFDYSDQNKPRYFKGFPGARAIMMFKMYSQGMYALILTNFMKGVVGKANTKAERSEARRILAGVITTHSLAAGVLGGVAMEPVRAALWLFYNAWTDDEDELDLDRSVREFLAEYVGNDWAEVIARGLPRAIGLDLSGRVGLNNMAMMGMRDSRSNEEGLIQFIMSLGGPIIASGVKMARGMDYLRKGEVTKAVESATPKFFRDAIKTWRMADDGLTDYNGNTIRGASKMDNIGLVYQSLGFTPATVAETYESRAIQKKRDTRMRDKRKRLMQMWRRSDNSVEFFTQEILPFNKRNRDYRISLSQLFQSQREQRRKERKTFAGAYTDKRETRELGKIYNTD